MISAVMGTRHNQLEFKVGTGQTDVPTAHLITYYLVKRRQRQRGSERDRLCAGLWARLTITD